MRQRGAGVRGAVDSLRARPSVDEPCYWQGAARRPPVGGSSGALPTSRGMSPVIGPPWAARAPDVVALSVDKQLSGVIPWTWPSTLPIVASDRASAMATDITIRRTFESSLRMVVSISFGGSYAAPGCVMTSMPKRIPSP